MLTIKIPEHSNGFFYVMVDTEWQELFSCFNHNPKEVDLVIEILNSYNEKIEAKTISPEEATIIKLDLQIRFDESQLKTKKDNLARLSEELKKEKEQQNAKL